MDMQMPVLCGAPHATPLATPLATPHATLLATPHATPLATRARWRRALSARLLAPRAGDLAAKQMRALERQHGWPQTCIIARSANTAEADQAHYKQCGLDGCIPKCGNIAKQVLEALDNRRRRPDEFVTVDINVGADAYEGLA